MNKTSRKTVHDELEKYDVLANHTDLIEVTEWSNGEGVDVCIIKKSERMFSLSYGEFKALKKLMKEFP